MLGVMIDCSRNAVMTVPAIKNYINLLSKMGYDTLMLYTEDTYEVNNEPYFGYMRGRYTKDELKEVDTYCNSLGIELIPCIQTLAHLNAIFQLSSEYEKIRDCDDILLIDSPRTYELIENMFMSVSECFTSKKIHIGMDEAAKVGLGKYLAEHGYKDRFNLINHHLHRVCEIADKYSLKPMIWSDMFCQLAMNTAHFLDDGNIEEIKKKANLPENISLVYWDYYSNDYNHYMKNFAANKMFDRNILFAGGAWTWKGFMPDNALSISNTAAAINACRDNGVDDIFMTLWGDDGAECSKYSILPALFFTAEAYRKNTDSDDIKKKFKSLTNCDWDAFMLLDALDKPGNLHGNNPSKYLIFNDVFTGIKDALVSDTDSAYYKTLSLRFNDLDIDDSYRYVFDTAKALCELLSVKADLGVRTRRAYLSGDKEALRHLAENDYPKAIALFENFKQVFWKQWSKENKPFGFDIQDIRLGGAIMRLKSCRERLFEYLDGNVKNIPELEETALSCTKENWSGIATPNVVTHIYFG